jgi:hypothetical protein
MKNLERWEMGDPESVAIRRESMTCAGCILLERVKLFGRMTEICGLGKPAGKRCKRYSEKPE